MSLIKKHGGYNCKRALYSFLYLREVSCQRVSVYTLQSLNLLPGVFLRSSIEHHHNCWDIFLSKVTNSFLSCLVFHTVSVLEFHCRLFAAEIFLGLWMLPKYI